MATQFSEVCERLKTGRIELLIVGPTLSREDCDSAVAVADSQMPPVKSLIQRAGHTDGHAEMLHEVIDAMEGPVCLMVAIEKMVSHASFAYSHMY